MLIGLSPKEIKRMNKKTVLWVKKTLEDKKFGIDLYNILLRIRQLIEKPRDRVLLVVDNPRCV